MIHIHEYTDLEPSKSLAFAEAQICWNCMGQRPKPGTNPQWLPATTA